MQWFTIHLRRLFLICLVLLLVASSFVESVEAATATWQNDAAPDLAGLNLYRASGPCANPGPYAKILTVSKPASAPMPTSAVVPNPTADGTYCHRATHFDTGNLESIFSNTVEFSYNVNPPGAPQALSVQP